MKTYNLKTDTLRDLKNNLGSEEFIAIFQIVSNEISSPYVEGCTEEGKETFYIPREAIIIKG